MLSNEAQELLITLSADNDDTTLSVQLTDTITSTCTQITDSKVEYLCSFTGLASNTEPLSLKYSTSCTDEIIELGTFTLKTESDLFSFDKTSTTVDEKITITVSDIDYLIMYSKLSDGEYVKMTQETDANKFSLVSSTEGDYSFAYALSENSINIKTPITQKVTYTASTNTIQLTEEPLSCYLTTDILTFTMSMIDTSASFPTTELTATLINQSDSLKTGTVLLLIQQHSQLITKRQSKQVLTH